MTLKPLISVIIPMYNAGKYIQETLDSVIWQTYSNWECIVVDDDSTDHSKDIVKAYCKKDERFFYYHQENAGASAARNKGFELSKGGYIQYLDADDIMMPEKIQRMLEATINLTEQVVLYCDMILGDNNNIHKQLPLRFTLDIGRDVTFDDVYKRYALDFGITPVCFLFPRHIIKDILWDTGLGPEEDMDYFLQILDNQYHCRFYPEVLVKYRNTPDSYSKSMSKSFHSSYKVLSFWMVKKNKFYYHFTKRCALVYKRSIFLYLLKRSDTIFHPKFVVKFSFFQRIFVLLIYPYTALLLILELFNVILKRI